MFRFIALAWEPTSASDAALARGLAQQLLAHAAWQRAWSRPGLQVFAAGLAPRIHEVLPFDGDGGVVLGKLFRRGDGAASTAPVMLDAADSASIVRSGGTALVRGFWGRYVAFWHDPLVGCWVLRDPGGSLPCYRLQHEGLTILFSWLEDILDCFPGLPRPRVNTDGLAAHLVLGELGGRATALEGVTQVLPGERLSLHVAPGSSSLLWNAFDQARLPPIDHLPTAEAALRQTVRDCALAWASCHDRILLRLSGGVDSSILLSCLASGRTPAEVTCLNYHSPGADSDERHYARLAATRAQRTLLERERVSGFRLEPILEAARLPTPGSHVGRMGSARMDAALAAQTGASALFTGGGGDQLFFEFRQWWPAADHLRLRGFDRAFLRAAMDAARLGKVSVWRVLRLALADRLRRHPPVQTPGRYLTLVTQDTIAQVCEAARDPRFVHPALLADTPLPIGKWTQAMQLMHPVSCYDPLEREAAPELVNPLLSQPLVELCLRLPTYVLAHGGRGRALARRAFADDLPPEIANRQSKGGMEEHLRAVLLGNLDFIRALLLDGELVRRGLIDRGRTETALSGRPTTLASRAGEIHIALGVEAWLRRWSPGTGRSA